MCFKSILFLCAFSQLMSCNPKEPIAPDIDKEIEQIENPSSVKGDNYGPIP